MNQPKGLCVSCRNASTCTFLKNHNEAVFQCDEFDGLESSPRRPRDLFQESIREFKSNPEKKDFDGYRGLCSICENRQTCTYPKLEGGIWHCEEYR